MIKGDFDEALLEMQKARQIDQFSLLYNLNVATVLFRAKRYDQAEAQTRKTLELDPNFARAYWLLGLIFEQKGNFDEAISFHKRAVELSDSGTLAKASLARAYAIAGNRAEAEKLLGELIENKDKNYLPSDSLAIIYAALGDKVNAFTYLEKAVKERPFSMFQLKIEQRFDAIRDDPRFQKIESEMHIPFKLSN